MGEKREKSDGQSAPLNAPIVESQAAYDGEQDTYAGERDDTVLCLTC